jgi:hypothetical protein
MPNANCSRVCNPLCGRFVRGSCVVVVFLAFFIFLIRFSLCFCSQKQCGKTAYPLESLTALGAVFHKGCFKCAVCNMSLNLKNFKGFEGKIYCLVHTPNVKATAVADDSHVTQALSKHRTRTRTRTRTCAHG